MEQYDLVWVKDGDLSHVGNVRWAASEGESRSRVWSGENLDRLAQVMYDSPEIELRVRRTLGPELVREVRSLMLKGAAEEEGHHVVLSHNELRAILQLPYPGIRERLTSLLPEE